MTESFEQRLRDTARAIPTPDAPEGLIQRVLAERASGARIALPTEPTLSRQPLNRRLVLAVGATIAAVAAFLLVQYRGDSTDHSFASDGGLFVSTAFAEAAHTASPLPPVTGVDGTKIVPRQYDYRIQYVDSAGRVTRDGGGSVTVSEATVGTASAWRVVLNADHTEDGGQRREAAETMFVARKDLAPLTRVVHVRPYRRFSSINIAQRFVGDSVFGEMRTDGGVHRPVARRLPARSGPYISDALAPLALVGVPLETGWTGSLSIIGWAVVPNDVFYPVALRVVGEERLTIQSGDVDCWKLSVVAGRDRRIEWVRKSDGVALRSIDVSYTAQGRRQYELLNP